jgi:hypothetical protein
MSSAQERPAGRAGTTDPTGSNAGTGAGDMADRPSTGQTGTGTTSTGTPGYQRPGAHRGPSYEETAEWEGTAQGAARAGGTLLAAALMFFTGLVTFFYGIVELIQGAFFTSPVNYIFYFSPVGRGITELVFGAVIVAAAVSLLLGMTWARILGVAIAVISAVGNFVLLPYYPVWSVILIALNVFIIWALTTGGHARRMA